MLTRIGNNNEFQHLMTDEENKMQSDKNYVCPRCEYPLIPVHSMEGTKRTVIALSCPEPYCDHMQMVPRGQHTGFELEKPQTPRRQAN